jgi:hypothetical protein
MSPLPRRRSRLRYRFTDNERGIAIVTVLLLAFALSAFAIGAGVVSMNAGLIRKYDERLAMVDDAALAGLEEGRSRLNGDKTLYPDSGYVTLESNAVVRDASGTIIPGLTRTTWAGPSGVKSGQYGIFGSIISQVTDAAGVTVVRRLEINQESFARYAYFSNSEGSNIYFGGGDQIFGPLHTNDQIKIHSSGARFRAEVRTAEDVQSPQYGTFDVGYEEDVPIIAMPQMADLTKLKTQAQAGNTSFAGYTNGNAMEARTRVEFVAVDLNADGDVNDEDEGFIKVYQGASSKAPFVAGSRTATINQTDNCGDWNILHANLFLAAADHSSSGSHNKTAALTAANAKCFLGGDNNLTNGFVASTSDGAWVAWGGAVDTRLLTIKGAEANYLHPITRPLNPNFKGVIYVEGKVVISGTVRSRVTLVSPNNIIIGDNVKQAVDPSMGICDDILGLFSGEDIVVADNVMNAPVNVSGSTWKTMRPVGNQDEYIHAVILALSNFTVHSYDTGPTNREDCGTTDWGRGCLQVTGGIIQSTRGAVGTTAGTGNLKRYSYNTCALTDPPPYFPTTGYFSKNRFYEINPIGFNVAAWFAAYQN